MLKLNGKNHEEKRPLASPVVDKMPPGIFGKGLVSKYFLNGKHVGRPKAVVAMDVPEANTSHSHSRSSHPSMLRWHCGRCSDARLVCIKLTMVCGSRPRK